MPVAPRRDAGAHRRRATVLATAVAVLLLLGAGGSVASAGVLASGPDGDLWFRDPSGRARIGRMTPEGILTWFASGVEPTPVAGAIAAGPDGNLWFTDFAGRRIGRITPRGEVTTFPLGMGRGLRPVDITAGPDGNLWFLANARAATRVGRITPQGLVTAFSEGILQGGALMSIAPGTDGNVWFTDYGAGRIGRITPAGHVAEFSVPQIERPAPVLLGLPDGIVAGPDGDMWFTASIGVGRISPSGAVRAIPVGESPLVLTGGTIASDRDGDLWVADGPDIARVTPEGILRRFVRPSRRDGGPRMGIVAGPDGGFWFADLGVVGRITAAGVITEFPPVPAVTIQLTRRRTILVRLRCPRVAIASCRGRVVLEGPGWRGPIGRFVAAPGTGERFVVPLRPGWRRAVRLRRSVQVIAWVIPRPIPGSRPLTSAVLAAQAGLSRGTG